MSEHSESAQVLRFGDINVQNILYLQAEISALRQDLRAAEKQANDSQSGDPRLFAVDWYTLAHTLDDDGKLNGQWQKVLQLRQLMKEYNEAVLHYHQMSVLPSPSPRDKHSLQEWVRWPYLGGISFLGRDREIWTEGRDLVSIGHRPRSNRLHDWISGWLMPAAYRSIGRRIAPCRPATTDFGESLVEYSDSAVSKTASLVGTVLASILPVLAIVALYLVQGTGVRLGLITVFSAIFSTCVWLLHDGEIVAVFSATSAFAAVQVVFVGTTGAISQGSQ
ncbi:hypothetical protein LTR56_004879 [Elasticomyces elasticus]|nr:hypothetical protein LTR56_004879 [Elasticomyces elasticus]KAK3664653.1 hypothetical protein LTR22_004521 [Elasticomyces elasticus]KAK4904263.1 hypothetical protein LTR49_026255 [Elasticomyces elasticus]KAK5760363.1 hypothetical protein LTS12_009577 [Elasticomyces elasticus]